MDELSYSEMHRPSQGSPSEARESDDDMADVDEEYEASGIKGIFANPGVKRMKRDSMPVDKKP